MAKVIFTNNGVSTTIQCTTNEKMKDIFERFANKTQTDINSVYFVYGGQKIKEDLTFQEIISSEDKKINQMNILVFSLNTIIGKESLIKSKYIICSKCKEDCQIEFNNFLISLNSCKNKHETNNLSLKEFENSQYIEESKIICDNCKENDKSQTYNKDFFIVFLAN